VGGSANQGYALEVIEELESLRDVKISVSDAGNVTRATLEPQGREIILSRTDDSDSISLALDELTYHQIVVLHEKL